MALPRIRREEEYEPYVRQLFEVAFKMKDAGLLTHFGFALRTASGNVAIKACCEASEHEFFHPQLVHAGQLNDLVEKLSRDMD